ncbi:hypothetical protein [Salinarimonas ramus]|uniref:hypothetical protein n=1 Tax=Salinarimonas ramus TaxID=690164 RepID=UPI00166F58BE|nr:hypothetical protein [Salinarimonas ramus]
MSALVTPDGPASGIRWYLAPLLEWVAEEWDHLLGEQAYTWAERPDVPAARAVRDALDRAFAADERDGDVLERAASDWYARHGLRSAAAGGIVPDLYIRRFGDGVEISWSGERASFAPAFLETDCAPGAVRLSREEVADPLRAILCWAVETVPSDARAFSHGRERFVRAVEATLARAGSDERSTAAFTP